MLLKVIERILDFALYFWKLISPLFLGKCCRFYPTCSEYAVLAVKKKGFIIGIYYAIHRFVRCNPFSKKSGFEDKFGLLDDKTIM